MSRLMQSSLRALMAAAGVPGLVLAGAAELRAQDRPLLDAAHRLNAVAPQAVAEQRILIGTYDAATKQFAWAIEESYPANLPSYKRADEGGDVPPQHVAEINSYNVSFEFIIRNKPAGFRLTMQNAAGDPAERVAQLSGDRAVIAMSPPPSSTQTVRMSGAGAPVLRITPHLREQLGAFVVPHLLVTIVYEPPGAKSVATYARTTSAGTKVSWNASRSSGFIETVQPDTLMRVFNLAVQLYLKAVVPGPFGAGLSTAWETIGGLRTENVTMISDTTFGTSRSEGSVFGITEKVWTRNDDDTVYPGRGDVFVVLRDVLFVYLALDGKVRMAPIAFAKADRIRGAELAAELPPDVAQSYRQLNPNFTPALLASPAVAARLVRAIPVSIARGRLATAPRFRRIGSETCEVGSGYTLAFEQSDYKSMEQSQAVTQTTVTEVTGLAPSLLGGSGTFSSSVTYSSAVERITGTTSAPEVSLACSESEGEVEVALWFDNLFGTFFTSRGETMLVGAPLSGSAQDPQGRPRPGQRVTLQLDGLRYTVRTDANGEFRFRFPSLPQGSGTLRVGPESYTVRLTGAPVSLRLKGGVAEERAAPPATKVPVSILVPGKVRPVRPR